MLNFLDLGVSGEDPLFCSGKIKNEVRIYFFIFLIIIILYNNWNNFRKYSVQGPEHPVSYSYTHQKPFGNYTFIAMDACLEPGPKRPFNFFGYLNSVSWM